MSVFTQHFTQAHSKCMSFIKVFIVVVIVAIASEIFIGRGLWRLILLGFSTILVDAVTAAVAAVTSVVDIFAIASSRTTQLTTLHGIALRGVSIFGYYHSRNLLSSKNSEAMVHRSVFYSFYRSLSLYYLFAITGSKALRSLDMRAAAAAAASA